MTIKKAIEFGEQWLEMMEDSKDSDTYQFVKTSLESLKSQKVGKWIGIEFDGYADGNPVYDVWECSNCHGEHEGEFETLPNYCPHCGSRMED